MRTPPAAIVAALAFLAASVNGLAQTPLKVTNLEQLNTAKDEEDPHLAGPLRLFYASNGEGRFQVCVSERRTANQVWPTGKPLDGPEGEARGPFLTADGHDFYYAVKFVVRKPDKDAKDTPDNYDLAHAVRVDGPRGFTAPQPIQRACTEEDEAFPWLTRDGRELYFSRKTKDGWRLFLTSRPEKTGAFGEPKLVPGVPVGFHHATLTHEGRTMVLQGPLEGGRWGLFRTTRDAAGAWNMPEPLDTLNSAEAPTGDTSPCLSLTQNGLKLYFASDRPGGKGGRDLWVVVDADRLILPRR